MSSADVTSDYEHYGGPPSDLASRSKYDDNLLSTRHVEPATCNYPLVAYVNVIGDLRHQDNHSFSVTHDFAPL